MGIIRETIVRLGKIATVLVARIGALCEPRVSIWFYVNDVSLPVNRGKWLKYPIIFNESFAGDIIVRISFFIDVLIHRWPNK